ncbi:hypothetical protein BH23PAT2_BH23PAT2_01860 [soil metagenome]
MSEKINNLVGGTQDALSLRSLAYQLRQPLIQISQYAQAGQGSEAEIEAIAITATRLIDYYILGSQPPEQLQLTLEPISLGAILQESAHELTPIAKQYECAIEVRSSGPSQTVMADARLAKAALVSLGYSFIEGAASADDEHARVVFASRRRNDERFAGVFSSSSIVRSASLKQIRQLAGKAAQQCTALSGSSSGILVADALCRHMETSLFTTCFQKNPGLAMLFSPSHQLQFV